MMEAQPSYKLDALKSLAAVLQRCFYVYIQFEKISIYYKIYEPHLYINILCKCLYVIIKIMDLKPHQP